MIFSTSLICFSNAGIESCNSSNGNTKREAPLGKEKRTPPSQTATTKLRATPNQPAKTNVSTASQKQTPGYLRPTTRTTSPDFSKQPGSGRASAESAQKPAVARTRPVDTAHKPTVARTKPVDKALTQKKPVPANTPRKTVDSQKPVTGKNLKTASKDVGKVLHPTNASNVKKSGTGSVKKKESGSGVSATKEQASCIPREKIDNPSVSSVLEADTHAQEQESSCIAEGEGKAMQVDEKGADDLEREDQEPLDIERITEVEINHADPRMVISESSTALENTDTPLDIKRQYSEDKSATVEVLEEQDIINNTNSCSKEKSLADSSHEDAVEEEEKEVEETALRKDEVDNEHEADEAKVNENQVVVVEKQESQNATPEQLERAQRKEDSSVSNDVIEETASKLREQRKNKVKALAGAFETVISLQEN